MKLGIIGLGKMGLAIGYRAVQAGFVVFGYNHSKTAMQEAEKIGIVTTSSIKQLLELVDIIWLMIPPTAVDGVLDEIALYSNKNQIIVDGGNSFFQDSIRRAEQFKQRGIYYVDCGTSGGLHGKENGFSLMIGGENAAYKIIVPILKSIAAPDGYAHMGPSGAGHYVKMVHNGIEYALMQAYAEGFELLKEGHFKQLDLALISRVWSNGSIIRSWLLELTHEILKKDQELNNVSGKVAQTGMGKWTVQEAEKHNVAITLIQDAVRIREESEVSGGSYATKLVALLRNKFGGHSL